jgi:hypothetical protein
MTQTTAKLLGKPIIALADGMIEPNLDKPGALLFYLAYRATG